MQDLVNLRSLLYRIPKSLYQEANESDFVDYMLDGLKLLPDIIQYENKIEVFEIIEGKVDLPNYVKSINAVYYQYTNPSEKCTTDLLNCCEVEANDVNEQICKPSITYKMWLDSPYFKETFGLLKYVGRDKSLLSSNCANLYSDCITDTFVITPQKQIYLSVNSGYICVDYNSPMCNSEGDLYIPNIGILHEFLVTYAISKHWENRQFMKEEQAGNFYREYNQKQALLLRQVRGNIFLRNVNIHNSISTLDKLMKLPEIIYAN